MAEEFVIDCGAPTLAGLKTGNLFTCPYEDKKVITAELRALNKVLVPKGLRIIPLRYSEERVLLYLYRIKDLKKDLSREEAAKILHEIGYKSCAPDQCMVRLIGRLRAHAGFPHEIGLFLSYPPEDVRGFMNDHAHCKYIGAWKVYGDVDRAKQTFARYKKCTDAYQRLWKSGTPLGKLIVAC